LPKSLAVSPSRTTPRLETRAWLRTVGRPGPERWVWPAAAVAWVVLVWGSFGGYPLAGSSPSGHHHLGTTSARTDPGLARVLAGQLLMWVAMVAATMLPLIAWNLRGVGMRTPRERRARATLEVAAGWALVWLAAGVVLTLALLVAEALVPPAATVGVVCALAVAWQFSATKRVALARCHRRFAPPLGAAATPACLRFGRSLGRDCLLSCGAGMALMTVASHHLLAVVALGWLSWRDRRRPHDRPGTAVSVGVMVTVAAVTILSQF
jgi:predicted metal-binding membrane protein